MGNLGHAACEWSSAGQRRGLHRAMKKNRGLGVFKSVLEGTVKASSEGEDWKIPSKALPWAEGQEIVQHESWPRLSLKRVLKDGEPWTDVHSWIQLCHWTCSPSSCFSPPTSCSSPLSTKQHHS